MNCNCRSYIPDTKYFLPFCGLSFHFLDGLFKAPKFLILIKSVISFITFGFISKKSLLNSRWRRFTCIFFLKVYSFSSCTSVPDLFCINSCVWCEVEVKIIIFHVDIQLSLYHLFKKLFFPHWIILDLLLKIKWPQMLGFISWFSVLFHWSICLSICRLVVLWLYKDPSVFRAFKIAVLPAWNSFPIFLIVCCLILYLIHISAQMSHPQRGLS